MNIIKLYNRYTLTEIGETAVMNEPTINEEINGAYTLNIEVDYLSKSLLGGDTLLLVDGQYFQIASQSSEHAQGSLSISLACEHVSYEMIDDEDFIEEYEDTAFGMLSNILSNTRFSLGNVKGSESKYYKPSSESVRQRLIDVANLFEGELIFDNFTVHLLTDRGADNGLEVELGVNQISIREEIDYTSGVISYELDCVDLSMIPGYDGFSTVALGDTIHMQNPLLSINVRERVVSYSYNPFKKQTLSCTVGNYINDLAEYLKEEKKDEKEEEDKGLLAQFKVGKIDCLALEGRIDAKSAVLDYIKDTSLQGVIPSADVELTENQTGVFASLKPDFSSYKLTAIITTETDSGLATNFYELPNPTVSSLVLPQQNISVSVTLVITKVPLADLINGKVPIVEDGDNATFIEAYGVRFLINDNADGFLEHFKVGTVDALTFDDIECTDAVKAYIKGQKLHPHASWEYETEKLKGIYASLKEQYKNHYLTFIHTKIVGGKTTTEVRKMPFANARIMEIPTAKDDSVIMVITKEPYESLTAANVDKSFIKAFGIRFKMAEKPWLEEFKIGAEECLSLPGLDVTDQAGNDEAKGAALELLEKVETITIKVNADYKSYFKQVVIWDSNNAITSYTQPAHVYDSSDFESTGKLTIKTPFPVAKNGRIVIMISEEMPGSGELSGGFKTYMVDVTKASTGEPDDYWLSEFRIGDVDCLALPGVLMDSNNPDAIMAEIDYIILNEHSGVFVTLKEEYADSTVILRVFYTNGTYEDIPQEGVDFSDLQYPNKWGELFCDKLVLIVTNGKDMQFLGVKFIKKEPEPVEQRQVMYAYIGQVSKRIRGIRCSSLRFIPNITNFRENFTDTSFRFFYFENLPETTELYPVAYSLEISGADVIPGIIVQVVDGVITSTIDYVVG